MDRINDRTGAPGFGGGVGLRPFPMHRADERIEVDARCAAWFGAQPQLLRALLDRTGGIAAQRWPVDRERRTRWHHAVLALSDPPAAHERPIWVRFFEPQGLPSPGRAVFELRSVAAGDTPAVGLIDDPRVAIAVGYLSDRFADAPRLAEVAAAVHTSVFHFHRLFSRTLGVTPKRYLLGMQLQVAGWLLCETDLPVGRVAAAAGFASHGHFTATFHRFVGMSPSAYRGSAMPGRDAGGGGRPDRAAGGKLDSPEPL